MSDVTLDELLAAMKAEVEAVELSSEDEPEYGIENNDTLVLYDKEIPEWVRKVHALWQRNSRVVKELKPKLAAFERQWTSLSQGERNEAYDMQTRCILAKQAEREWDCVLRRALNLLEPKTLTYEKRLCRGWILALIGEPER